MRFGILYANTGHAVTPEGATALATIAEENGFESLWTVEHVVVPADYQSAYPYSPTGKMPGAEESPIPDPLIWLTWVAAATRTLRVATGILILPQRNPVVLAKELATLDMLSGGRLTLGVGVGWLREEFDALGVPFDDRGRRTDEHIEVLRALWREPETTYRGDFVRLDRVKSYPKPAQAGGIPIAVGGHSPAAARRAGRLGDEFFPAVAGLDQLRHLVDVMRAAAEEAGRDPASIGITAGGAPSVEEVKRLADLGVTRMVIPNLGGDPDKWKARLGSFSETVIAAVG
ncbi:MAG TPA: LLM class F420-dependent oxidoreductase [Acidimicrobiales bacterium]|nr:LLM class F420-dependent oxidoreductase [Acidimicrobiales bacterium]